MDRPPSGRWSNKVGIALGAILCLLLCLLVAVATTHVPKTSGLAQKAVLATVPTPLPQREFSLVPPALPRLSANEPPAIVPEPMPDAPDRVADARARRGAHLASLFQKVGVEYPAREVYLRVFKTEGQLELWTCSQPAPAPLRLVQTYPILRASGRLGPKRREGDGQVPEGFYTVDRFNPRSLFHVSLELDYPNAADRLLTSDPEHPGTDIFIHGNALSVGCLAMGDTVAEELYLVAADAQKRTGNAPVVHIFPCRMNEENWQNLLLPLCTDRPELGKLWRSLRSGYNSFEASRRVPTVQVQQDGSYQVN